MKRLLLSWAEVEELVLYLIRHSVWFTVTPLPDDHWEVEVKPDAWVQLGGPVRPEEVPAAFG